LQEYRDVEINGIAHIQLTVNDLRRAIPFYESILGFMGLKVLAKAANGLYMVGGRTAVAVTRASDENRMFGFDQRRIGLHHICFRARSVDEIISLHAFLVQQGVKIVHPPEEGEWAPGYHSVLFEDPEGIRLELDFVPGQGLFEDPGQLPLNYMPGYEDYPS
jgi:catechol 2,3-dioxygenase-like lactoylglutathione lyase family enzyme